MRFDKSIDPVKLVHELCVEASAHPERKRSRWIQRMTPITSIRKTLSVDLGAFAREILKPHFHAGGPPRKVSASGLPHGELFLRHQACSLLTVVSVRNSPNS